MSLNFLNIISGLNKLYPNNPHKVLEICFECLDAIYENSSKLKELDKLLPQGIKFKTKWGKGIGFITKNREIRNYCHEKGFVIFVYVNPENNYRGIAAPGGLGVDFTEAYEKLIKLEPNAEWYLHFTKDLLICGSDKALNLNLSSLELKDIIELIKLEN